jgi:hypothetical protein
MTNIEKQAYVRKIIEADGKERFEQVNVTDITDTKVLSLASINAEIDELTNRIETLISEREKMKNPQETIDKRKGKASK